MADDLCRHTLCNSKGACETPSDGSDNMVCTCDLGYQGEHCETTVNGHLSVPLTASIVVVIVGLVILAFAFAKLRQRQKRNKRKRLEAQQGLNVSA